MSLKSLAILAMLTAATSAQERLPGSRTSSIVDSPYAAGSFAIHWRVEQPLARSERRLWVSACLTQQRLVTILLATRM